MENLTLFRISVLSTMSLLLAAIITPIATVAVDLSKGTNAQQYLEFVCVWCQYGSTDNNPDGTARIYNITSFDFFYLWIPILVLFFLSFIPIIKSFPNLDLNLKISDKFAINLLWVIAALSIMIRLLLTLLIGVKEAEFQEYYPGAMVIGELGWGSAALILGAISSASAAMFGFIEFEYEMEDNPSPQSS